MIKKILDQQLQYTKHYFDSLNLPEVEKFVDLLFDCKGTLFFSGIGKSGLVAKKIAVTMVSTGTRASYISPTDAVHGDLGMLSPQDIFVILSKSGETDELIRLLPAIRNKNATVVAIVCNPKSRLGSGCHHSIVLPCERELCPFDMAPTTSTTAQIMFGDLLTIALMQRKEFGLAEYALNHPSGRIGKRITLKVKDLMLKGTSIPICFPSETLINVLTELSNKRCGCVFIVDKEERLLGIFMDGDLRRCLQKYGADILNAEIGSLMTQNPRSISPEALAWDALKLMEADPQCRISVLPVIAEEKVQGLLHIHDIIQSGL
jgi:arabinose-5-phosphate isomerase